MPEIEEFDEEYLNTLSLSEATKYINKFVVKENIANLVNENRIILDDVAKTIKQSFNCTTVLFKPFTQLRIYFAYQKSIPYKGSRDGKHEFRLVLDEGEIKDNTKPASVLGTGVLALENYPIVAYIADEDYKQKIVAYIQKTWCDEVFEAKEK